MPVRVPPAPGLGDAAWGAGWAVAIAACQVGLWGFGPGEIAPYIVRFALSALAIVPIGLLALNLVRRRPWALSMRWQVVILLLIASAVAGPPWNSVSFGCPEC